MSTIWYVLVLVSVLSTGREVVTEVEQFAEPAQCIMQRDNFEDFMKAVDWSEIGIPKPTAECRDQYGNKVSGEI